VKNLVTGLAMLLGSIYVYFNMGAKLRSNITGKGLSEIFWPQTLFIILMIMSVILMATDLRNMKAVKEELRKLNAKILLNAGAVRLFSACAACFIYVQSLRYLGFLVATPILLSIMLFLIGFRGFLKLVPAPIIITAVCVFCFSTLAKLPLPTGTGIFKTINLLF
jgi:hypothetical protein